ncbi:MAG TPA: hypothetical protein VKB75_00975 [Jatrophihabitans sp.]|nr:hypothetical protein [Jatrophihabitans sp.]
MTDPRPRATRTLVVALLLVAAGLGFWALYVKQSGAGRQAYSRGGAPADYVQVVAGKTYGLAVPGGVSREAQLGVNPSALQCTASSPGRAPGALSIAAEKSDTKATDRIATFDSTITGRVHIECAGLGTVYVDNSADAPYDWSGVCLLLAVLTLVIGLPLLLSALRSLSAGADGESARSDLERVDPASAEIL